MMTELGIGLLGVALGIAAGPRLRALVRRVARDRGGDPTTPPGGSQRRIHLVGPPTDESEHLDKMAAIGMLAAGIAHEIKTPLGAATSMQETRKRAQTKLLAAVENGDDETDEDGSAKLLGIIGDADEVIDTALERVAAIVNELRQVARHEASEPERLDVTEPIESALTLAWHKLKGRVTIERDFAPRADVIGHPGKLSQVFLNLFVNAAQAIEDSGTLRITVTRDENRVRVDVTDTGSGIDPSRLDAIFEMGFTTKSAAEGTGLGLAISRRIVEAHGGTLSVSSAPGTGSTFTVSLPAADSVA